MKGSSYIRWAKSRVSLRYSLAKSGIPPCTLDRLAPREEDHAIFADNLDGWPPLLERLARRYGVGLDQVALAHGTSMANHLACAAILERDDEVLVELPCYEPLQALPEYLGAKVGFFERDWKRGYRLEIARIVPQITPRTRLVVLSNLHNPSGALAQSEDLSELARLADHHGLYVLVDEVYLEFLPAAPWRSAIRLSPRVVVTSSLTKAYGLDGLRAGWIVAAPEIAERVRRLNDIFSVTTAHPTERLAARALDRLDAIAQPVHALIARNRPLVDAFIASKPRLSWVPPAAGSIGFVRVSGGSVEDLVARLEAEFEMTVVPGRFFGAPDHFRLGFGLETPVLEEALARLGRALA